MLNLNKRVSKLLEKTTSLECQNVCKEVLETYTYENAAKKLLDILQSC